MSFYISFFASEMWQGHSRNNTTQFLHPEIVISSSLSGDVISSKHSRPRTNVSAAAEDGDGCNDDSYFHHTHHYQGWGDVMLPPTTIRAPHTSQEASLSSLQSLLISPRSVSWANTPYSLWTLEIALQSIYHWRGDSVTGSNNSQYDKVVIFSGGGHLQATSRSKKVWGLEVKLQLRLC